MSREQLQTLTEPMYYILLALTQECCGVDIMARVKQLSHNRITVGPGTLYAMLAKFEEKGIIRPTVFTARRKSYIITEKGHQELHKEYQRLRTLTADGEFYFGQQPGLSGAGNAPMIGTTVPVTVAVEESLK